MKKLLLAALGAAALLLSGCDLPAVYGEITGATVVPQVAQTLVDSFAIAEGAGIGYLHLPLCGSVGATSACRTKAISQTVFSDLRVYGKNRDAVLNLLRTANGGPIPVVSYNTLVTAYGELKADLAANGLNVGS